MTPETHLLTKLDLSRPELLALRRGKFPEGTHWVRGDRSKVLWTDTGLNALSELTGVDKAELVAPLDAPTALKGVVMWANYPNKRLVQVMPDEGDAPIRVRVKDALLYVPGMAMEYRRNGERGWMEAKRPRSRGRF